QPALIIWDWMRPTLAGVEVRPRLRQQHIMTPMCRRTARDDEFDKVLGLELGADDSLPQPFSPRDGVARVKAILRRTEIAQPAAEAGERLAVGRLEIFPERYEAAISGKPLELTPKEFELLLYLARHKGRVLTRDQLLSAVWNYDFAGDTRIVDVHISHLREKIEEDTKKPAYIKTVRGLGYKLEEPKRHG
ncbi:response regulator transcription factor, partial [Anoxybacillus geothermalis]|nr:response regulator transcription factor [Anoxybacillus geothermalis]